MAYSIEVTGMLSPHKFIKEWAAVYDYKQEYKYLDNIHDGFKSTDTLRTLMSWKNGTGDKFTDKKEKTVSSFESKIVELRELKKGFSFEQFESIFLPEESSTIWKIFLLHLINPEDHPIFDQHVYRSYTFLTTGIIIDTSKSGRKEIYTAYKKDYMPWFNSIKTEFGIAPRDIDKALFAFGRLLKAVGKLPIQINANTIASAAPS